MLRLLIPIMKKLKSVCLTKNKKVQQDRALCNLKWLLTTLWVVESGDLGPVGWGLSFLSLSLSLWTFVGMADVKGQ